MLREQIVTMRREADSLERLLGELLGQKKVEAAFSALTFGIDLVLGKMEEAESSLRKDHLDTSQEPTKSIAN